MEFKVIVYIIVGIVYFLFSMKKKADEQRKTSSKQPEVKPPVSNPIEQILEEMKRMQQAQPAKKVQPQKPALKKATALVKKQTSKATTQTAYFEEGKSNYESAYQRPLTDEEKIERGTLHVANEGIYKIDTMEEAEARAEQESKAYQVNAREAVIGSIILERKF